MMMRLDPAESRRNTFRLYPNRHQRLCLFLAFL